MIVAAIACTFYKSSSSLPHSNKQAKEVLEAWDLVFSDQPVRINGRLLNPPSLMVPRQAHHMRRDHHFDPVRVVVQDSPEVIV